jgi:hypothetical protein
MIILRVILFCAERANKVRISSAGDSDKEELALASQIDLRDEMFTVIGCRRPAK